MSSKSRLYFQSDNISFIFRTTSTAMIFSSLSGVIAVLIDGIIASQFLGDQLYAGISLLRPFIRLLLVLAGFLSTGCASVCSTLVTQGKRNDANGAFNFTVLLILSSSAALILFCLLFPRTALHLCGVSLESFPDLVPYMYEYLNGYIIGIAPMLLIQVISPILVMDGGRKFFIGSSITLCICDIVGDMLNVSVFNGGAFGMGLATSIGYIVQVVILIFAFIFRKGYFHFSLKGLKPSCLTDLASYGMPVFLNSITVMIREVIYNYIILGVALTYRSIAARGIQSDLFLFLLIIPIGLGNTLNSMAGIYYRANDRHGLQRLLTYSLRLGFILSVFTGLLTFLAAPLLTRLYTKDPYAIDITLFAIRCMSVELMFDTSIELLQSYLLNTGSDKLAKALIIGEHLLIPVIFACILGTLFGSKGVLASLVVSKIFMVLAIFLVNCIRCHGIPQRWKDVMLLPEDFGGAEEDNIYAEIRTMEDVTRESARAHEFCLKHHEDSRVSNMAAIFVEEMAGNVVKHSKNTDGEAVCVSYRLFADKGRICFSIMDLGNRFDPTAFYELYNDAPYKHFGIRMVMNMAEDVCYFNTYRSNNLTIYLESDTQPEPLQHKVQQS